MSGAEREQAEALDRCDPLAEFRDRFALPKDTIYLDGNSLGALPRATVERLRDGVEQQWGMDLIRSWNVHGWIDLPQQISATLARLIGASPDELIVCDSVSINLFKLLASAIRIQRPRRVILTEQTNFPTDLYVAQGLADWLGDVTVRAVPRMHLREALTDEVAVLLLTQVDYRTAVLHDINELTGLAHRAGALTLWDLSHSVGAVPLDLRECRVDFAVGCGYKYLCGGPGAPAFAFVASAHHDQCSSPLVGWMGHAAPFEFDRVYRPADGAQQLLCGTPPVLSLMALQVGVELIAEIGTARLRDKSVALTECFRRWIEPWAGQLGILWGSPVDPQQRGSHVALHHDQAYAIVQALIEQGVIGDFRMPDIVRLGFAAPYLRFVDVWDAAETLRRIMRERTWDRPEFHRRRRVT